MVEMFGLWIKSAGGLLKIVIGTWVLKTRNKGDVGKLAALKGAQGGFPQGEGFVCPFPFWAPKGLGEKIFCPKKSSPTHKEVMKKKPGKKIFQRFGGGSYEGKGKTALIDP